MHPLNQTRPRQNHLLGGKIVNVRTASTCESLIVDVDACRRVAALLKAQSIPVDREESSLHGFKRSEIGNFYLLLVAICHQTTPRDGLPLEGKIGKRTLRGWDYLSAKLENAARLDRQILSPAFWRDITAARLREMFRDETFGETLTDPDGRARLIRDLGHQMRTKGWKSADEIYDAAYGNVSTGSSNLLDLLSEFYAYRDPVHKKAFFFLALMQNSRLWVYSDPDHVGAPVDYHEVRGHLRLGTVQILDPDLRSKLLSGSEVTSGEDVSIRQAVHEALMLVSKYSGINNASQLHYLFWNIFRSCCTRENPHCVACSSTCTLPSRYVPLTLIDRGERHCPFSGVCESFGREPKLLEHIVRTDYY